MITINKSTIYVLCIAGMLLTACTKDTEKPQPSVQTGAFKLKLDHRFGMDAFKFNTPYTTAAGEALTFTNLRYYVSNIRLQKADGSWWSQQESYFLVDATQGSLVTLDITQVPTGEYTALSYVIGVDSTRNVSGAQTGALSVANGMFWSWNSGYIFLKIEGTSPQAGSGTFAYHVGGFSGNNNALQQNQHGFNQHLLRILPAAVPQVHLLSDMKKVFEGNSAIKVADLSSIHMPGSAAVQFANNFSGSFAFDHIHD